MGKSEYFRLIANPDNGQILLDESLISLQRLFNHLVDNLNNGGYVDIRGYDAASEKNEVLIDKNGIDPRFLVWSPNLIANSNFLLYQSVDGKPDFWQGSVSNSVTSSIDTTFIGARSLKILPGAMAVYTPDSTRGLSFINPSWIEDMGYKCLRFACYHRSGKMRIKFSKGISSQFFTLTYNKEVNGKKQVVKDASITFESNEHWPGVCNVSFEYLEFGACNDIRIYIENIDSAQPLYINAPQLIADKNGAYPQLYVPGKYGS